MLIDIFKLHVGGSCPLGGGTKRTSAWVRLPRGQDPPTCNLNISTKIIDPT